jgi:RHS repeat-associated protein
MTGFDGLNEFDTDYSYDYRGNRWKRVNNYTDGFRGPITDKRRKPIKKTQINFYLDDVAEYSQVQSPDGSDASGFVREYVLLPGMICSLPGPEEGECSFTDQMNVAAVFSASTDGVVNNKITYSPYGKAVLLRGYTGGTPPFDFNAKRREPQGDLLYYGARYYDAASRQFVSIDPLRLQSVADVLTGHNTLQPYVYAASNPTTHSDPIGLQPSKHGTIEPAGPPVPSPTDSCECQRRGWEWRPGPMGAGQCVNPNTFHRESWLEREANDFLKFVGLAVLVQSGARAVNAIERAVLGPKVGYRAVSDAELKDIKTHGFRPHPEGRSMEDKWFSETRQGAEKYMEIFPTQKHIVEAEVPKSVYNKSFKHPNIDNTGPGFAVPKKELDKLKPNIR